MDVKKWNQVEISKSFAGPGILDDNMDVYKSRKVLEQRLKFKLKGVYIMGESSMNYGLMKILNICRSKVAG